MEQQALASLPVGTLMTRAATAVAGHALKMLGSNATGSAVLVLAGPGNNGGDAVQAAALLRQAGADPSVMLLAPQGQPPADAQRALDMARTAGVPISVADPDAITRGAWQLALDGLFGIGLTRPLSNESRALVDALNTLRCPVLAVDVPSGLDADTGMPVGADGIAVRATDTITFIADKPGLHTGLGRDLAGNLVVDALEIDRALLDASDLSLNRPDEFHTALQPRPHYSHKGSFGDLRLVGGAHGMQGALVLAARAALHCGAGRVFAGFLDAPPAYDDRQPELMCRHADEMDFSSGAVVIGPGLSTTVHASDVVRKVLLSCAPAVFDADALNLISADEQLRALLRQRQGESLLTPHPLEAARLLATDTGSLQADRIRSARRLAAEFNAVVILKGSGSVIAAPGGTATINPTGNPALATGGTGDVLAGICGALLAQGVAAREAARAATWIHGRAADELVAEGIGPVGLTAGELAPAMRRVLNRLIRECSAGGPPQS